MKRAASLTLLALLSVSCGSTVQTKPGSLGATPDSGVAAAASAGVADGLGGPGLARTPAPRSAAEGPGTSERSMDVPGDTTGAGPSSTAAAVAPGKQGPGVTATSIKVGMMAVDDPNKGNASLGVNTANVHNLDDITKAVVDDLNKRGGISGRKVELLVRKFTSSTTNEQLQSQACEAFTRDNHVLASFSDLGESAEACFEKAGVATFGSSQVGYGEEQYRRYPHLLSVGAFSLENQVETDVRGLKAQGWMSGWSPVTGTATSAPPYVGILAFDLPVFRTAIEKHEKPALAAAGVKKVEVFYIRPNLSDGQADAQAAVLKFKQLGVSHVTFLDNSGGLLEVVFATNANSQGYFPRFACDSGSCNQIVAETMPQTSMRGAVEVGWSPLNDVPASHDYVLPQRARCEKIMVDHGMTPYSRNDQNVMANICQGVWFFEAAAKAAGPTLFADTLMQGAFDVGARFSPPATFANEITATKHAGAAAYRYAVWDTTCGGGSAGCFIYTGPVRRFES